MVELIRPHRLDEGDFIHLLAEVRQQLADPRPALAVLSEFVRRAEQFRMALDEGETLIFQQIIRARLHVQLDELRLIVEQFVLRRRPDMCR